MKTLHGFSTGLAAASLTLLAGCADDISNPFSSGDSGSTGTTAADGGDDDGGDDGMGTTTSGGDTMGVADSTGTTAVDNGTTTGGEESTTGMEADSTTGGGSSGSSSDGDMESSSDDDTPTVVCPADSIDMVPMTLNDSLVNQDNEFGGTCGGGGAPDMAFTMMVPEDGFYVFDTVGSSFDTVLYVLDGDCTGTELGCNDDTTGAQSEVGVVLAAGQVVTVVVDAFGITGGAFNLNVAFFAGTCPDGDIGNAVPQTSMGDSTMADNTLFGSCGGNLANDDTFTFTAPQDGIYTFDTIGSDYDTVLYVREDCGGMELGCNDDISGTETASQVNLTLSADDQVVVIVDGNSEDGNYTLNVDIDSCPDEALPQTVPNTVMGSTSFDVNSSNPSCGFSNANDYAYTFIAPSAGSYIFDTFGSALDTVLHVTDGASCDGAMNIACNDDTGGNQSQVVVNLAQDQEITVIVDGFSGNSGDFQLNVSQLGGDCPNADLGNTIPATAMGDTSMSDDTVAASCGGLGAGDETYTFTAPQDGLYFIDTAGSAYTPQISVFDSADCSGTELACGNDGVGVGLVQDQQVSIVIGGETGVEEGVFTFTVDLDPCPDGDLGSTVPQTVNDTTTGLSNSLQPSCGSSNPSEDFGYTFTAPADGSYTFDTNGTGHDTVLHITDGAVCGGPELDCDDDGGLGLQSEITLNLTMGQQVVVMVDGYSGADGPFTLNVN